MALADGEERASSDRGVLLWSLPSLALLFGMVFLPTAQQPAKAALLLVAIAVGSLGGVVSRRRTLHRHTALWALALCGAGLFFMARGLVRGEPGALRVGTVYVLWPAAFVVVVGSAPDARVLRRHVALLVAAVLAASVYSLEFVLEQSNVIPRSIFPDLFADQAVGFYEGFIELRLPPLAVLPFALPFLIAAAVCWGGPRPVVSRVWVWVALLVSLTLALVSGRRAVQLVTGLAPLITLALVWLLPREDRRTLRGPTVLLVGGLAAGVIGVGALLAATYDFDSRVIFNVFREGFDPTASLSSSIRAVQLHELLEGWAEHPLLGVGHGGFLREHIRDATRPWSYELSYPTLLFQTGALGALIYGALLAWIFAMAVAMIREGGEAARTMLPLLVGLACFLVANATNPYLLKFDLMWTVFLPLGWINRWLVDRERRQHAAPTGGLA